MGRRERERKSYLGVDRRDRIEMRSGQTGLHLSRSNGCVLAVKNARTGRVLCSVEDRPGYERLFRLLAMRRGERGRVCDAKDQAGVLWNCDDNGVTITYPSLSFDGETADCSAVVRIDYADDNELHFTLTIENHGDDPIHEVQFPMLPGWNNRDGEPPIELTAGAKWRTEVGRLPKFGGLVHGGHQSFVAYPGSTMYMPWLDFSGPEGGLAMINYMERPYTGGVAGVNQMGYDKGSLECYGWAHYPLIGKAGTWTSPPVGVGIREGSWHTTADRYYDWFRSTIGIEIEQPASLRTGIGFQNIYTREFGAARINDFESIPEHARAGVDYGVRDLSVWDHASMGNYVLYEPDVDLLDYTPGDCEKLRRAIAEAREQGAVVSALVNFRHINVRSELYARYKSEAVLSLDGSEQRENWCGTRSSAAFWSRHLGLNCILLSPRSPATRKRVEMLLEKYLELGYTALFYDQPFLYQLDYNHMGAESRPDDASSAWYDIIQDARSRLREENADAYTIGEQCDIFSASRAIDLHMEWNFTNNGIEDLARVHYACPHALLSYVIDYTTTGEAHASHAFAAGLYLCLAIDGNESNIGARPALAEHVRRLAALRKKCADRTVFGRFRHTEGLMCDNDPGIVAYAYDSDHGPAVVLAAGDEGGTARVRLDASCFRSSASEGGGCLFLLNGDEKDVGRTDRLDCALSADQVVVWYL